MSDTPRIVKTEDTCGGSPRVDGTRISVPVLLEHIAGYVDLSEIPRTVHRHVTIEDCQQALQYAANAVKQHDSLLAEVERVKRERDQAIAQMNVAIASTKYRGAPRQELLDRIASLEADNARLASEQQHCAKCGGVECHALAGMFCGEHSYEGCGEWNGCPICVNVGLQEQNAALVEACDALRPSWREVGCWCERYHQPHLTGHDETCMKVKSALADSRRGK